MVLIASLQDHDDLNFLAESAFNKVALLKALKGHKVRQLKDIRYLFSH